MQVWMDGEVLKGLERGMSRWSRQYKKKEKRIFKKRKEEKIKLVKLFLISLFDDFIPGCLLCLWESGGGPVGG